MKGILITLEGGEGCGKSTQIELLHKALKKKGFDVLLTREPGGTAVSQAIRGVLLDPKNKKMIPLCETFLYMASRAQLVDEIIKPALKKGRVVLCDRWLDATVAYQGYAGGVDVKWIKGLGKSATQGITPKLSIYLDLPVKTGLKRATSHKRADRVEQKSVSFHEKVRKGYLSIARSESRRFKVLTLSKNDPIQAVHARILKEVHRVIR